MAPAPLIRDEVVWPTQAQVVRQLGVVVAVMTLWGGAFWGAMHLPTEADTAAATASSERREARRRQAQAQDDEARGDEAPAPATTDGHTPSGEAESGPAQVAETVPAPAPKKSDPGPAKTAAAPQEAPPPAVITATEAHDTKASATETEAISADAGDAATAAEALAVDDPLELLVEDVSDVGEVSFAADVMPILERRCVKCHGGERDEGGQRIEEGLSLLTWDDVMAGSIWGSVVEPGDPAASYLLELIQNGEMPDKEPRLLPKEVRIISQWIATGAPKN